MIPPLILVLSHVETFLETKVTNRIGQLRSRLLPLDNILKLSHQYYFSEKKSPVDMCQNFFIHLLHFVWF